MQAIPKSINRLLGKAMHDYSMLKDGDRVLIGVSGGIDSLALTWILSTWRHKSPINYEIKAVHLDNGFDENNNTDVEEQLAKLDVQFITEKTTYGIDAYNSNPENACFECALKRRNHLFEMARQEDYTAIALGHHKDDIIETFFLNMLYAGNISTMLPKQKLFKETLSIIRPMAYISKDQVKKIATIAKIKPVKNPCPMSETSKREEVRTLLQTIYDKNPKFKSNIFSSLSNVRTDYLLMQRHINNQNQNS